VVLSGGCTSNAWQATCSFHDAAARVATALRRSELVALDVEDLSFDPTHGLLVTIGRSKTDQEQEREHVAVPYARAGNNLCPVRVDCAGGRATLPAELHATTDWLRCAPGVAARSSRERLRGCRYPASW
jgi:hypothetical protein